MLDEKMVTRTLIVEKGHVDIINLNPEDIYVPQEDKDSANNITRILLDPQNIDRLQMALMTPDWSKPLIAVEKINGGLTVNGKTYWYKLVAGYHRMVALKRQCVSDWLFDLYKFETNEERVDYQAIENDHEPRKEMEKEDWANYLSYKFSQGWLTSKEDMVKQMNKFKHVHPSTKTAAINRAVSKNGVYQDFVIRDWKEIQQFTDNPDNYTTGHVYTYKGNKDPNRMECGWTVKEGYEHEYLMNAIKKYHDTRNTSYFINWVKTPNDKAPTATDKRDIMTNSYDKLETALLSTFEYYQKHGTFPWRQEAWFPQDNKSGEDKFIKINA
jgi:hypothetical protein